MTTRGVKNPRLGTHREEGATTFETMEQAGHTRSTMTSKSTVITLARHEKPVRRVQ